MFRDILIEMRPKQWYKNCILFAGIIFSMNVLNINMLTTVFFSFIVFCLLSASGYFINDILDKERDKIHPKKCNRPIASGRLSLRFAFIFLALMLCTAVVGAYLINIQFLEVSLTYFFLIIFYSLYLKHIAIIDVITISSGFVLRAIAGCVAIKVSFSPWLIICAFLIALFLALGKRRHELILLENGAGNHRKVLDKFSSEMLEKMMTIASSALIMSYSLYTFLTNNNWMMVTIPIIIYGIFRYTLLVHSKNVGGEPEMLFKDTGMLGCIVVWVAAIVGILYVKI